MSTIIGGITKDSVTFFCDGRCKMGGTIVSDAFNKFIKLSNCFIGCAGDANTQDILESMFIANPKYTLKPTRQSIIGFWSEVQEYFTDFGVKSAKDGYFEFEMIIGFPGVIFTLMPDGFINEIKYSDSVREVRWHAIGSGSFFATAFMDGYYWNSDIKWDTSIGLKEYFDQAMKYTETRDSGTGGLYRSDTIYLNDTTQGKKSKKKSGLISPDMNPILR